MTEVAQPAVAIPRSPGSEAARRALLLVNPASGAQQAVVELPVVVAALERAGIGVTPVVTTPEIPMAEVAAQAVRDSYQLVIAAGGDGTVSDVAKGLLHRNVPLGILPFGTYNNIARSLDIPDTLEDALDVLMYGHAWRIDTAAVNGVPFIGTAGVGLVTHLFPVAEQIKSGAYHRIAAALRILHHFYPQRLCIEFEDGTQTITRPLMALVSNMSYFGVGFAVAPEARPDSGKLVLSLFERFTKPQLLRHFFTIAYGRRVHEPRITTYEGTRFHITTVAPLTLPVILMGRCGFAPQCVSKWSHGRSWC